ncbi:lonely Cys domain-containing protein, partial [Streptomyces griseorubiginosus]|uniref:lonely Cys domain-containing protein n=1 Tax=Streptomyces griseorubiginosus TaxID=67304 RepID=UPI001AD724E1
MAITVKGFLAVLIFALTGEHFLEANEDVAYDKSLRIDELKTGVSTLKGLARNSIETIGAGFPPGVADQFIKAINEVLPYLDEFETDLEKSRQGQLQISMQIREAKWNIIAELIRLAAELAVLSALSFITGGLSATHAAVAKMISRIRILTIMLELLNRTKLIPSLTEAAEEAFTTLAVRLAMMTVAPQGQRPKNIDWKEVGISALFGAGVGIFQPILSKAFNNVANNIVKNRKDPLPELGNKFNTKIDASKKNSGDGVTNHHNDSSEPNDPSNKHNETPHRTTSQQIAHQVAEFNADGLSEFLVEPIINGVFYGNWSLNWQTYLGSGLSERVEEGLHHLSTGGAGALSSKLNLTSQNLTGTPNSVNALVPQGGGTNASDQDGRRSDRSSHETETQDTTESSPVTPRPLTSSPLTSTTLKPSATTPETTRQAPPAATPPPAGTESDPPSRTAGPNQATVPNATASTPAPDSAPVSTPDTGRGTPGPTGPSPSGSTPTRTPTPTQTQTQTPPRTPDGSGTDGPKAPAPVPTDSAGTVVRPAPTTAPPAAVTPQSPGTSPPPGTTEAGHDAPAPNGQGAQDPAPRPRTTETGPDRPGTAPPAPRRTDTGTTDDSAADLDTHSPTTPQPESHDFGHDDEDSGYDSDTSYDSDSSHDSGYDSDTSETAGNPHDDTTPAVHDVPHRKWIARHVTADDLPDLSGLHLHGSVDTADLAAAGIPLSPTQRAQALLGGGRLPLSGSGLTPADQVKALMLRPGPWPQALDVTAANTTRRIWQEAYTDFTRSVPDSAKDAAPRAWDSATALVLPSSPDHAPGDPIHTQDTYRHAVRQVADLLVTGHSPAQAAALADRLRQDLGLPPRTRDGAGTTPVPLPPVRTSTQAPFSKASAPPTPAPVSTRSGPGGVVEDPDEVMVDASGEDPPVRQPVPSSTPAAPQGDRRYGAHEIGEQQRPQIAELAEQIVAAGLRDLRAGLSIPRTTVTVYGIGRRFGVERARAVGLRRAKNVAALLRAEIQRQLDLATEAVQMVQNVRSHGVRAEDFPITVRGEDRGTPSPAARTGQLGTFLSRSARQQMTITVDRSPLSAAVDRLEQLFPAEFGTDPTEFDPDWVALKLRPGPDHDSASPTSTMSSTDSDPADSDAEDHTEARPALTADDLSVDVRELYDMVADAMAAGRATSVPALIAHHLGNQGVLSDATRVTAPDGTPLGRNWTGRPVGDIDTSGHYETKGVRAKRKTPQWAKGPAPTRPYVVATAGGDHASVELVLPDGRMWTVSEGVFAHLLAADTDLAASDAGVPVVLASRKAGDMGLDLPRELAFRTGRTVWAHTGSAELVHDPDSGRDRIEVADERDSKDVPLGDWIDNRPEDFGADPDAEATPGGSGRIRTIDGESIPDQHIKSVTLTIAGRPTGRAILTDRDQKDRESDFHALEQLTHWSQADPVANLITGHPIPVPWKGRKVYFLYLHGRPGQSKMVKHPSQREVTVKGPQPGRYLKRRSSVRRLKRDAPIVLLSCWAGAAGNLTAPAGEASPTPYVPDPLTDMSVAQDVANETRRVVFAPNRVHGMGAAGTHVLFGTPDGTAPVTWDETRPEPTTEELAALAEAAGLRAGPDLAPEAIQPTTLRLVHALRKTFGPAVEDDKDDPSGTYRGLLRGIAALETMRHADPNLHGTGEFTLDLLHRATRAHLGQSHTPGTRPPQLLQSDVRALLDAASARLDADPGSVLSDLVALPTVDRARQLLARHSDPDVLARDVLGLDPSAQVTPADRQNLLWSTVKAVESVDNHPDPYTLTRKVLHLLDSDDPQDPGRRADLLWTAAAAAAVGRDTYNPTALAAHHLQRNGALDRATRLLATDGTPVGRNWTGNSLPGGVVPDQYWVTTQGTNTSTPHTGAWVRSGADAPGGYFLFMNRASLQGSVDMPWPDGGTRQVPYEEIGELLVHDPELSETDPSAVDLVPVGLGPGALVPALTFGARTAAGRTVHVAEHPVDLVHDASTNEVRLEMTRPQSAGTPDWTPMVPPRPKRSQPAPAGQPFAAPVLTASADTARARTAGAPPLRLARTSEDLPPRRTLASPPASPRVANSSPPEDEREHDDVVEDQDAAIDDAANLSDASDEVMADAGAQSPPVGQPVRLPTAATVPPGRSRRAPRRAPQEIDDEQRRQIAELAEQIVAAGLRDLRAGLKIPQVTVTAHGTGRRLSAARAHATISQRRARNVAGLLRAEIQRRLDLATEAVHLAQNVRGRNISAEDFPITVLSETRDVSAAGSGRPGTFFLSWSPRQQMTITVDRSPLSAAVDRLEQLFPAAFGTDPSTFDPDRIASQFGLGPDQDPVSPTDSLSSQGSYPDESDDEDTAPTSSPLTVDDPPSGRRHLYELVADAMAAGRAASFPALVAHYLVKQGLLSDATRVTAPDGTPLGRNWTGRPVGDIDSSGHYETKGDQEKRETPQWAQGPAPTRPYVVGTAGGDHIWVVLGLPTGRTWTVSEDVFAHLLAADTDLAAGAPDVPVVLASPKAGDMGLDLPRKAAFRTGRTVWAHTGSAKLTFHPGTGRDRIQVPDERDSKSIPVGTWIDSRPHDLGADPDTGLASDGSGRVRTVDGKYIRDRDVKTVTLTIGGRPTGRAVFTDAYEMTAEATHRAMERLTHWHVVDPVTDELSPPIPVPWKDREVYFLDLHGAPGHSEFVEHPSQDTATVDGVQTAGYLTRRRSVERLDKDVPIVLFSCWGDVQPGASGADFDAHWAAPAPFVPDPLADVSTSQDLSTRTRRVVYAPTRVVTVWDDYSIGLEDTPDGTRVAWTKSTPEPTEEELDDLAEAAGLRAGPHLAPEAVRPTTRRLVRALRKTFGPDIEDDKHDLTGTYRKLFQDIVALEKLRRADQNLRGTGEFTLDLLHRATRAHLGESHTPGTRPPKLLPSDVRAFLDAASTRLGSDPGAVLSDLVSLPTVDRARHLLAQHPDPDALARDVLGLEPSDPITPADRQNLLWATVKAVEGVENHPDSDTLTTKVLHLRDGENPQDADRQADLLWTAAAAAAVGRDTHDPSALAAHHLQRNGALAPATMIRATNGTPVGRNWTRRPVPGPVVADRYRVIAPDGTKSPSFRAPWHSRDAKPDDHPGSYFLAMDPAFTKGMIDMPWPDGGTRQVPYDEIAQLLSHDPELAPLGLLDVGFVPVGLAAGDLPLAQAIAARTATGRAVHMPEYPLRFVHDPSKRCARLEVICPQPTGARYWTQVSPPARPRPRATPVQRPSDARVVTSSTDPAEANTIPTGEPPLRPVRPRVGMPPRRTLAPSTARPRIEQSSPSDGEREPDDIVEDPNSTVDDPGALTDAGDTADPGDLGDAGDPGDLGNAADRRETADAGDRGDPGDRDPGDPGDAGNDDAGSEAGTERSPAGEPAPVRTSVALPLGRSGGRFGRRDVDEVERLQIAGLAEQIVAAGLRDLRAGLRIPQVTVTGYGNGPRFVIGDGAVEHARTAGLRRAKTVARLLREEIQRRLDLDAHAVRSVQGVRNCRVTADDFPVTVVGGGRVPSPAGWFDSFRNRSARRHAVITVDRAPLSAAVDHLAQLFPSESASDPGHFDPDSVLSTLRPRPDHDPTSSTGNSAGPVGGPARSDNARGGETERPFTVDDLPAPWRELYETVAEFRAAGRVTSVPALTAHYLVKQGLLSDATRLTAPDGTPLGRNWTGKPVQDIDTSSHYQVSLIAKPKRVTPQWAQAPASPRPYVVATSGGTHARVDLSLPDGRMWRVSEDVFAHLLAADADLAAADPGVPVVLASPKAGDMGLDLPRKAAFRSGRSVWAHSGTARLAFDTDTGRHRIEVRDDREIPRSKLGIWIESRPDDLRGDPEAGTTPRRPGRVRTADGRYIPDQEIKSATLTIGGRPTGRAIFTDADQMSRESAFQTLERFTQWSREDPVTGQLYGAPVPVPWKGRKAYFLFLHGGPGRSNMVEYPSQRTMQVEGTETGGYLTRRDSLELLDTDVPIVLISCSGDTAPGVTPELGDTAGRAPYVPDPLAVASVAEDIATETGRVVYAPDAVHTFRGNDTHAITDTPDGARVTWSTTKPRPTAEELHALAEATGLRGARDLPPEQVQETMLRLVRALRKTFGPDVEDDKDDPSGTYRKLLRGIVALENLRRADFTLSRTGEFTLDLLYRATRAHLGQTHTPGIRPQQLLQSDVRALLDAASASLDSNPRSILSDIAPLPSVDRARSLFLGYDRDALARNVLDLAPSADVTPQHLQNLLWATVQAVESVQNHPDADALTRKVLHLRDNEDPRDPRWQAELLWTTAMAAAAGRDTYNPAALAAYHLQLHGALGPVSLLRAPDDTPVGRNWTQQPVPGRVVPDQYWVATQGGTGSTPRHPRWYRPHGKHPGAYFLLMDPASTQGMIDMPWPGGGTRQVPHDEIAELLSHDPELTRFKLYDVNLVPVGLTPGDLTPGTALSARTATARTVLIPDRPFALVHHPSTNLTRPTMTVPRGTGPNWRTFTPPAPAPPP